MTLEFGLKRDPRDCAIHISQCHRYEALNMVSHISVDTNDTRGLKCNAT